MIRGVDSASVWTYYTDMSNAITRTEDGRLCCADCNRWVHEGSGDRIRHSTRCDTPDVQPEAVAAPKVTKSRESQLRRHAKVGDVRTVATDDEILDAVKCGILSVSDAMNQDL